MFWISIILIFMCIIGFILTYCIDPLCIFTIKVQNADTSEIQKLSEDYVNSLGIKINKSIKYRFVRYTSDKGLESDVGDDILLGTFHVWNNTYYIDISIDLNDKLMTRMLTKIVKHETRHMIVEYMREKDIIDLSSYTEEVANEDNKYYNDLFDSGIFLLKEAGE